MMNEKQYFVYILTNKVNTVLYTGVTNNLVWRVAEHRDGTGSKFTNRYNIHKLVYFEITGDINSAIEREKQIKAGSRQKKIELIVKMNPEWIDLLRACCLDLSLRAWRCRATLAKQSRLSGVIA